MREVKIIGTGCYVPENIVKNDDLTALVETSDEWIITRTGIRERRISQGENTSEIAAKAALKALENSRVGAEELDLIIVATLTADMVTPAAACMVQAEIGAKNAAAFDLNAACSGFIFGVNVAYQFIRNGTYKKILVVGAEVLSKIVNWSDRNTCVLFGDGAGAVVLSASEERGIISNYIGSEGDKWKVLKCASIPVNNPYVPKDEAATDNVDAEKNTNIGGAGFIEMDGREVFKFATRAIVESIESVLKGTDIKVEDIDYIVPHQANLRIIDFACKKLNLAEDKFYVNLEQYGNTSGASIPIALDEMNRKGMLKRGDKIIFVGFGGGLTFGACLVEW
jgi:3-oxoacyl-[acyl-carrier-protein] synthase III